MLRALKRAGAFLVFTTAYVATAEIGLRIDSVGQLAALVWPPAGLSLAVLVRVPQLWPAVAVGAFAANVLRGAPIPVALAIAIGNTLEAWLGAALLRRVPDFEPGLERTRDVGALVVFAALGSTLASATIGSAAMLLGGLVTSADFGVSWRTWWLGDVVSDLAVAPVILAWWGARFRVSPARGLELVALASGLCATGWLVFGQPPHSLAWARA